MSDIRENLDDIRRALWDEASALLSLRDALAADGNAEAATIVDEARNGIYRVRHDLKRAYPPST